MNELEKINRELMMIGRDLAQAREFYLLRIIRNKRQPIAARYAAMMLYKQNYRIANNLSNESLTREIMLFLNDLDRPAL